MRTPAGKECPYFYGDYFRGREREECQLLQSASLRWQPSHCSSCPIPAISAANSCEHMQFHPTLKKPLVIIGKTHVSIDVYCRKCECSVAEPRIGCGQCHSLPESFLVAGDELD